VKRSMQLMMSSWKHLLNYYSFHNLNRKKLVITLQQYFSTDRFSSDQHQNEDLVPYYA
jgi:ribosomal protein S15P/S13E